MNERRPPGQLERYWNRSVDGTPSEDDLHRERREPMPVDHGGYRGHHGPWQFGGGGDMSTSYRGIGPKNYRRSDQRVFEDICDWLTEDLAIDAADIEVTVDGGEVTLHGSVPTRQMKRWVGDLVERVHGVRDVHNNLKIRP